MKNCVKCGCEIAEESAVCPNCGGREVVEETPEKVEEVIVGNSQHGHRNTKWYVIVAVVAIVAIIVAVLIWKNGEAKKLVQEAADYESTLESASYTMLLGAAEAEEAGNLIKSVWYNAIYEERDAETDKYTRPSGWWVDDFNEALENLFSDPVFVMTISDIESNQELVTDLMRDLKNPPEEYDAAYEAVTELYYAYTSLTNLVVNPSGSLTSFSEKFNDADDEVVNCYERMKLYID